MSENPRFGRGLASVLAAALIVALAGTVVAVALGYGPPGLRDIAWPWKPKPAGIDPRAPVDPGRKYHLTVWDYRLPFTSPAGAPFSACSEQAIHRFELRHPNVTVDLVLIDAADGPAKLAEALAAGYPPDVYCSPYGNPASGSDLQVPVGLYLDYDAWARYHPVAWQAAKVGGTVWAWPRWLVLWPWVGNEDLLTRAGVDTSLVAREGWTREEFTAMSGRLASAGGHGARTSTLAASCPAMVLRDLLFAGHLAAPEPPAPDTYWLGAEAGAVVSWLAGLREAGGLEPDGSGTNPGILDSFIHGRSAVLASPSPWTTDFLLEFSPRPEPWQFSLPARDKEPPLVLLPPPHRAGEPTVTWVSAATVSVFRQARYKGDDNTHLAVELARELTTGLRPWLRDEALCLPADLSELASWELRSERFGDVGSFAVRALEQLAALPPERLNRALEALSYGPWAIATGGQAGRVARGYLGPFLEAAVAPAAARFWYEEGAPGDLLSEITQAVLRDPGTPDAPGGAGGAGGSGGP